MADRERLQAEKMSVEARKREVEEQNRDPSRRGRTAELKNKIWAVKESLEEQQHQTGTTLKCVCAQGKLKRSWKGHPQFRRIEGSKAEAKSVPEKVWTRR